MTRLPVVATIVCALLVIAAAPGMTVRQFLTVAEPIPRNATAALRSDTRRLISEVSRSVNAVKAEQAADIAAGRRPAHCIPRRGTGITPETLMRRFETLPVSRQDITVTQAIREWMIERYPCPA